MADHPTVCALCNIYLDNGQPTSILKLKLKSCIIIHKYIFLNVMVQSMFNQDKQFAWSAEAFIIIFKEDDNKYKSIENVALCFLRKYNTTWNSNECNELRDVKWDTNHYLGWLLIWSSCLGWMCSCSWFHVHWLGKSLFFLCLHEHVLKCTYKLLPRENTTKRCDSNCWNVFNAYYVDMTKSSSHTWSCWWDMHCCPRYSWPTWATCHRIHEHVLE